MQIDVSPKEDAKEDEVKIVKENCPHRTDERSCALVDLAAEKVFPFPEASCLHCIKTYRIERRANGQVVQDMIYHATGKNAPVARGACVHLGEELTKDYKIAQCQRVYECDHGHGNVTPCQQCQTCPDFESQNDLEVRSQASQVSAPPILGKRVVYGANAHGLGDLMVIAWIGEGHKTEETKVLIRAQGDHADLARIFGQYLAGPQDGPSITTTASWSWEREHRGRYGRVMFRCRQLGVQEKIRRPTCTPSDEGIAWAEKTVKELGQPPVLLFPLSEYVPRRWPVAYWVDLAWGLHNAGFKPIIMTNQIDTTLTNTPKYFHQRTMDELCALMQRSALVVANDSGPTHIAGTIGVKTMTLLGPTHPKIFGYMNNVECLRVSPMQMGCVGCHFDEPFRAACDQGCQALYMLDVPSVLRRILGFLIK